MKNIQKRFSRKLAGAVSHYREEPALQLSSADELQAAVPAVQEKMNFWYFNIAFLPVVSTPSGKISTEGTSPPRPGGARVAIPPL